MTTCTGCRHRKGGCGNRGGCTNTHMPALTRQEAAMLPATAAFTLDAGRAAACPACGSAWVPCGQTNTAGCTACGQTAGTFCPVCGQTIAGCASCNAYGACHRGSRAGLAILYAPGVSLPGVTAMSRSCPWRGGQTEDPYRPVPQATILRP